MEPTASPYKSDLRVCCKTKIFPVRSEAFRNAGCGKTESTSNPKHHATCESEKWTVVTVHDGRLLRKEWPWPGDVKPSSRGRQEANFKWTGP